MDTLSKPQRALKRLTALKTQYIGGGWRTHHQELSEYIQPRKSRFLTTDRATAGGKRNQKIVNGTPTWAARVLSAGMMAGITSPARAWFRLTTPEPGLAEFGAVRSWLHVCEERIRTVFARSNIYNSLHQVYEALATPGTAAMYVEDDAKTLLRAYVLPIGSFYLANSARQQIDTIYCEKQMTVSQLVEMFGLEACSAQVKSMYERKNFDEWVDVVHAIQPNQSHKPGSEGPAGKEWESLWFEVGQGNSEKKFLREAGYEDFPVMCPRWSVTGEDVYGSSPGMEALGDARALQLLEKRAAQAFDKVVNPPMKGPSSLATARVNLMPGETTYVDALSQGQTFSPAYEISPQALPAFEAKIQRHEARIEKAFFADLWLMLAQNSGQMTAREVAERHEEKMLQLGPVMERLEDELLDPLIDRAFGIMLRAGELPPPPEELQGQDLRVEYVSIMAQAQKMLASSGIRDLAAFVGSLAAVNPEVIDKLNCDEVVDEYADSLAVKPDLVRTDEEVAELRASRAQAQAQAQQMEQANQMVQGAKTLSETDTEGNNALTQLLGGVAGVPSVQ